MIQRKLTSIWVTVFVCLGVLPICKRKKKVRNFKKIRKPNIKCYLLDKWHATKPYEICLHMFVLIILEVANRTYYANAK